MNKAKFLAKMTVDAIQMADIGSLEVMDDFVSDHQKEIEACKRTSFEGVSSSDIYKSLLENPSFRKWLASYIAVIEDLANNPSAYAYEEEV